MTNLILAKMDTFISRTAQSLSCHIFYLKYNFSFPTDPPTKWWWAASLSLRCSWATAQAAATPSRSQGLQGPGLPQPLPDRKHVLCKLTLSASIPHAVPESGL